MIFSRWVERRLRSRIRLLIWTMIRLLVRMVFRVGRDLVELPAEVLDLLDLGQDLFLLLLELPLGDVVLADVEHLLDDQRLDLDLVLEAQDLVQDESRLGQGLDDRFFAALDLPGDGDLAFAGQEGDVAHFPEVELDRIGRPLQALEGQQLALAALGDDLLLLLVEDLDPVVVDRAEEIVESPLVLELVLERLVDLLEQQIALLPALRDELGDVALRRFHGKGRGRRRRGFLLLRFHRSSLLSGSCSSWDVSPGSSTP